MVMFGKLLCVSWFQIFLIFWCFVLIFWCFFGFRSFFFGFVLIFWCFLVSDLFFVLIFWSLRQLRTLCNISLVWQILWYSQRSRAFEWGFLGMVSLSQARREQETPLGQHRHHTVSEYRWSFRPWHRTGVGVASGVEVQRMYPADSKPTGFAPWLCFNLLVVFFPALILLLSDWSYRWAYLTMKWRFCLLILLLPQCCDALSGKLSRKCWCLVEDHNKTMVLEDHNKNKTMVREDHNKFHAGGDTTRLSRTRILILILCRDARWWCQMPSDFMLSLE